MTHEMKLQPSPYAAILEGRKTVEMRLYDERRRGISVGDEIVFTNNETGEKMSVLVTSVKVSRASPSFTSTMTRKQSDICPTRWLTPVIWRNITQEKSRRSTAPSQLG